MTEEAVTEKKYTMALTLYEREMVLRERERRKAHKELIAFLKEINESEKPRIKYMKSDGEIIYPAGDGDKNKFAFNLKRYRKEKKISAKKFAELIGIKYTTYTNYENQGYEPNYKNLCKIADALGVTLEDLLR